MGPHFRGNDVDYYTAIPSAFHSRSAWASRGDTSGYSGSTPTVGEDADYPDVSPRDAKALREWKAMGVEA